jgi:radical SAM superfamily enzyme YgiQ (UPF0313 family)
MRILLLLPPFWPPLIPPMGLATLKARLRSEGFTSVITIDLNAADALRLHQRRYFEILRSCVPAGKRGVLGKMGHEVLENHLLIWRAGGGAPSVVQRAMAEVLELSFYIQPAQAVVRDLSAVVERFYVDLDRHLSVLYDDCRPDVLGVSVPGLSTLAPALTAFASFKRRSPQGLTILGGSIFLTGLAESPDFDGFLASASDVDHVVVGDGGDELIAILKGTAPERKVHLAVPPGDRPGGASRTPDPDYTDFHLARYPYLGTEQTISCPFMCGFCNLPRYQGTYRKRPAELMADELHALHGRYGTQLIYMADSLLNPVIGDLTAELARRSPPVYIDGFLRVHTSLCNEAAALRLRQGGLYRARMGVESGSQRVLDLMDKRTRVEQATGTVRALAAAGTKTTVYLVVGFPGETEEDFQQTLDWITELQNDVWQVDARPFTYWYTGQCHDDAWAPLRRPLYTEETAKLMVVHNWVLECPPSREEIYRRMNRTVEHCASLGIPDPHEIREHYQADLRWQRLHANAVPPLMAFAGGQVVDECRGVRLLTPATAAVSDTSGFAF